MFARRSHLRFAVAAGLALLALVLSAPAPAVARGTDGDGSVAGICGSGATSKLRLIPRHGAIRVEFKLDTNRGGQRWRVVLVQERRVVWRGRARTRSGSGSFRIRRSIRDLDGADEVSVRASGPAGNTCNASAVLTGS
jgi:hypothetical protein